MSRTWAIIIGVLGFMRTLHAEQVVVRGAAARFEAGELGGIRTILRMEAVRPDRREIDYVLLSDAADATSDGAPEMIQVVGVHGREQTLADVDGGDCALQRFMVFRSGPHVALLTAVRADHQTPPADLSSPAPFDVQVYHRQDGGDPGDSSPIFVADGVARRTSSICKPVDVAWWLNKIAATIFPEKNHAQ